MPLTYPQGATAPTGAISWYDNAGNLVNTNAAALTAQVSGRAPNGALVTITGINAQSEYPQNPNVLLFWGANDLASLFPGTYTLEVKATLQPSGLVRIYQDTLIVTGSVF